MLSSTLGYFALASGAAVCLLALAPANTPCSAFDVSGRWVLRQSTGHTVSVNLRQDGSRVTGTAIIRPVGTHGGVHGSIDGDKLHLRIEWGPESTGIYNATISSSGYVSGRTWDFNKPAVRTDWRSGVQFRCLKA